MYNKLIKKLLSKVNFVDGVLLKEQIRYSINDGFSIIEIYICDKKISYRTYGDAYTLAMLKWLQIKLQNKENINDITLCNLILYFDLPKYKYKNAAQLIELIKKINEINI